MEQEQRWRVRVADDEFAKGDLPEQVLDLFDKNLVPFEPKP